MPGDKTQCRSMKVQGNGGAANALTCLARLGVRARLMSKIADDVPGKCILGELKADGVDTSFLVVAKDGQTPFSYVMVDESTRTRTCIFTPGFPVMEPADISQMVLKSALEGARFVYFDARHRYCNSCCRRGIVILFSSIFVGAYCIRYSRLGIFSHMKCLGNTL
ncbi:uncharacterized protein LOC115676270 isoform X1 [Syzygium oleosum]|uniref:uncharacterized protein LOC115676270 isoform X1 n=1 Tax=Syzygium oleosum TaxID=219896 RepID=UPI0024B9343A|nr:uncharacterized protein LOC115676270 isoform X1 [Syzygium oleosum]